MKDKNKKAPFVKTYANDPTYEFCPRCDANLTLQRGFDPRLPYWVCLSCGEMLINPSINAEDDIAWICDKCEALLNTQKGFDTNNGIWKCLKCGYENIINESEIYSSQDEYLRHLKDPYRGISDEDMLKLSRYREEKVVDNRDDVVLVKDVETGKLYIKKLLASYDKSIYKYLMDNPVDNVPKIVAIFEGASNLVIIEEYVEGTTVDEILSSGVIPTERAIYITKGICGILNELHSLPTPIIHRDIKPSNIMLTENDEVYLLDINIAKWYAPEESDDTRHMGTVNYAAPEQAGFSLTASSPKTDIYAVGMLLNMMLTGCFPKEKKAEGPIWRVIKHCINLDAKKRYSATELIKELNDIQSGKAMKHKTTDDLNNMLDNISPRQIGDYLKENKQYLAEGEKAFYYYFKDVLESKNIKLKDIYYLTGVTETYGSKIITMEKHTKNRDLILKLCISGHFTVDEINRALKLYGMSELYAKVARDACIIIAVNNRIFDLYKIDELLDSQGLKTLS